MLQSINLEHLGLDMVWPSRLMFLQPNVITRVVKVKKQQTGQQWYARLSDENKAEYLQKLRIACQQKKDAARSGVDMSHISAASLPVTPQTPFSNMTNTQTNGAGEIQSTCCSMTRDLQTPCSKSSMKHVSTSAEFHGQHSFLEKSAYSDKKRQHGREIYSLMSDEQRQVHGKYVCLCCL